VGHYQASQGQKTTDQIEANLTDSDITRGNDKRRENYSRNKDRQETLQLAAGSDIP
jgi:hypothetical protein